MSELKGCLIAFGEGVCRGWDGWISASRMCSLRSVLNTSSCLLSDEVLGIMQGCNPVSKTSNMAASRFASTVRSRLDSKTICEYESKP